MKNAFVETLDFGKLPIRKNHTEGQWIQDVELSNGSLWEIRHDISTNQPFIVEVFNTDGEQVDFSCIA